MTAPDVLRTLNIPKAHLCVSANVLIAPDLDVCGKILERTLEWVLPGGYLLLLVPSHESARMVANCYVKHRAPKKKLGRSDRYADFKKLDPWDVAHHVWKRWQVRTQCYSLAGLRDLINDAPFDVAVERIEKVEYAWDTELNDVKIPASQAKPYDWCAIVRRCDPDDPTQASPPDEIAPKRPLSRSSSRSAMPPRARLSASGRRQGSTKSLDLAALPRTS